jgi:hypothetical protein
MFVLSTGPSRPPTSVSVTSNSTTSVNVCWQACDQSYWNGLLRGYLIRYRKADRTDGPFLLFNVTSPDKSCAKIMNLEGGEEYELAVSCYNFAGEGPYSDYVRFSSNEERPRYQPTNVTAVAVNSTAVLVTFISPQLVRSATFSCRIIASEIKSLPQTDTMSESDNTVIVIGERTSGRLYAGFLSELRKFTTYRIVAVCYTTAGDGPPSQPVDVQTLDDGKTIGIL